MTLSDLELDVYRRLDYADSPPTSVKARIDSFINQRHHQLLASDRMRPLRLASFTATSMAYAPSIALPGDVARVVRVMDITNNFILETRTREWYRTQNPNPTASNSTPTAWVPMRFSPTWQAPYPGVALWVDPSAADNGLVVTVASVLEGGIKQVDSVTLTDEFIKLVSNSSGVPIVDVLSFETSRPLAVGALDLFSGYTLADPFNSFLIARMLKGDTTTQFYRIALYPTPSAALTYLVDYERAIPTLTTPNDEPLLPADFHDLLAMYARCDEYEFKSDDRWQATRAQVEERKRELKQFVENHDAFRMTAIPKWPRKRGSGPIITQAHPPGGGGGGGGGTGGLTQEEADALYAKITHAPTHGLGGADQINVSGLPGVLGSPQIPQAHKITHQVGGVDAINVAGLSGQLATPQTPILHHTTHELGGTDAMNLTGLSGVLGTPQTPAAHHASHESAGGDKVSIAGLSGLSATPQTPAVHHTTHETGGTDVMSLTGLTGVTGTPQPPAAHKTTHQSGGTDQISVTNLTGLLGTAQTPTPHAATHQSAGSDALSVLLLAGFPGGTTAYLRADGTFAVPPTGAGGAGAVGIVIDGAGSVLTTGIKGFIEVPRAGTISAVTLISTDPLVTSGSIVIDIWKDTFVNYAPTVADTITASAKPTLSGTSKYRDTTLTGWTKTVAAGDILGFKVDSVSVLTKVTLSLTIT